MSVDKLTKSFGTDTIYNIIPNNINPIYTEEQNYDQSDHSQCITNSVKTLYLYLYNLL